MGGHPFGRDVDAEEIFRAMFGGNRGGGGGSPFAGFNFGGGGGGGGGQVVDFTSVVGNILSTMARNPWTILVGLTMLSSVVSLIGTIAQRPFLLIVPFLIPAKFRAQAAMVFMALLMYGIF